LKRQTKLLVLALISGASVILIVYAFIRSSQISALRQQASALVTKAARSETTVGEMELLQIKFPLKADISSFVEGLYTIAQQSGLENVEITTLNQPVKAAQKGPSGRDNAPTLVPYQIRIACEGRYRAVSQYFKQVQHNDRYSTIVSFDMRPEKNLIKLNMVIEILSFEVQNAS